MDMATDMAMDMAMDMAILMIKFSSLIYESFCSSGN